MTRRNLFTDGLCKMLRFRGLAVLQIRVRIILQANYTCFCYLVNQITTKKQKHSHEVQNLEIKRIISYCESDINTCCDNTDVMVIV